MVGFFFKLLFSGESGIEVALITSPVAEEHIFWRSVLKAPNHSQIPWEKCDYIASFTLISLPKTIDSGWTANKIFLKYHLCTTLFHTIGCLFFVNAVTAIVITILDISHLLLFPSFQRK